MVRVRGHYIALILLLLAGSASVGVEPAIANPQSALPEKFNVPKGTSVKLELTQAVSSEAAKIGDRLSFRVLEEVKVGDIVLIQKGSAADGFVSNVMSQRQWGLGRLEIYVSSVRTRNGFSLPVYGVFSTTGQSSRGSAEALIPEGTVLVAKTELDIPLDKELFNHADATTSSKDSPGA